jgi:hypothetical protein
MLCIFLSQKSAKKKAMERTKKRQAFRGLPFQKKTPNTK